MAGQGTAALELLEEVNDLDIVLCPVGGGGLLAGTGLAAKSLRPKIKVIAAEPENVDDAAQSFRAKKRLVTEKKFTIADGLRTNVGAPNFEIIQGHVDDIVTVGEEAIIEAMRAIWQTMKIIVETSAAVPFAAILERKVSPDRSTRWRHSYRRQCRSRCTAVAKTERGRSSLLTFVVIASQKNDD